MRIYEAKISYKMIGEEKHMRLESSGALVKYMENAFDDNPTIESLWIVMMNRKNMPLGRVRISTGGAFTAIVSPREIFKPLILASATAFILVHNHPSGDPAPSSADVAVTRNIRQASKMMEMEFIDHVIIGDPSCDLTGQGYYSFNESGML